MGVCRSWHRAPPSGRKQPLSCSECPLGAKTSGGGLGGTEPRGAFSPATLTGLGGLTQHGEHGLDGFSRKENRCLGSECERPSPEG